jgi:vancomycin resistance protein YoaR
VSDDTATLPETPPARPSKDPDPLLEPPRRVPRWVIRGLMVGLGLLALAAVVLLAWFADSQLQGDKAPRGTTVAGRDVGGLSAEDVETVLNGAATDLARQPVTIRTPAGDLETTAGNIGLTVDVDATATAVLELDDDDPMLQRPFNWLGGFVGERRAPVTYRVNRALVEYRLGAVAAQNGRGAVEPTIQVAADGWEIVPGETGQALDMEVIVDELAAQLGAQGIAPIELEAAPVDQSPQYSDDEASALADEANRLTDRSLTIQVEGASAEANADLLRSFFEPVIDEDEIRMRVRRERLEEWLGQTFSNLRVPATNASFDIGLGPVVRPSANGKACCTEEAPRQFRAALEAEAASVTLETRVLEPELTTAEANALGIREPVATFTTNHPCCAPRVQNIHRFADLIRGAVIPPGETLSLNEYVGQRTEAQGFVEAPAIYAGVTVSDVGGGVSQFATTTFNAAFFAGMDFAEYQAHSIYISRYPYGREATISWPSPDLAITNNSPYGVLVWPTYTGTSITVTLWSTRWVEPPPGTDQTGQSEASIANGCTRVTTERTRRFVDPAEAERIRGGPPEEGQAPNEVVDTVFAIYQPGEGRLC